MTKTKWGRNRAAEPEKPVEEEEQREETAQEPQPEPEQEPQEEPEEESSGRGDAEARIIAEWKRGEAELRELVPDFRLIDAMQNEVFARAITRGSSVAQAYLMMTHAGAEKPERREIPQNAQSANKGTGRSRVDPATMSREEFRQYINNIKNI